MKYIIWLLSLLMVLVVACSRDSLPIEHFYDYDRALPLETRIELTEVTEQDSTWHVQFLSVHDRMVTGLLTVPNATRPAPVVLFLHGVGDSKTVDYIEAGTKYLTDAGYAVLRIDVCNHGERKVYDYEFDLTDGLKYWTRDIMTQTVFDLRRSVDLLETRPDVDCDRIGFFGISLGGMIGTVFCGVEPRIKVPVITLAGGSMNLMFGAKALSNETAIYLSIFDPINFVDKIAPRPLLLLNASKDEIVPPITTKLLYKKARDPKKIIWYPTTHRRVPLDEAFPEAIRWFDEYL